jgi:CBS-domain-containing membrane protein
MLRMLGTDRAIDFKDIVDSSAVTVRDDFPIKRAFIIFRSLGLRHMTVVNKYNVPVGIVTRKELLGMHIEHSLHHSHHGGGGHVHDEKNKTHVVDNPLDGAHMD